MKKVIFMMIAFILGSIAIQAQDRVASPMQHLIIQSFNSELGDNLVDTRLAMSDLTGRDLILYVGTRDAEMLSGNVGEAKRIDGLLHTNMRESLGAILIESMIGDPDVLELLVDSGFETLSVVFITTTGEHILATTKLLNENVYIPLSF